MTTESRDEAGRESALLRTYMNLTGSSEAAARNTLMYACYVESDRRDVEQQEENLRRLDGMNQLAATG